VVDEAAVAGWLERYIAAWRSYDPSEIGALFAEDATYRYHPWDEGADVVVGRDAIVESWLDEPDAQGSWTAEYRPWLVGANGAVAVGTSRYAATEGEPEAVYHNVFLLRFDDAGRCTELTELYMLRPR
jgi:hypothetical protein